MRRGLLLAALVLSGCASALEPAPGPSQNGPSVGPEETTFGGYDYLRGATEAVSRFDLEAAHDRTAHLLLFRPVSARAILDDAAVGAALGDVAAARSEVAALARSHVSPSRERAQLLVALCDVELDPRLARVELDMILASEPTNRAALFACAELEERSLDLMGAARDYERAAAPFGVETKDVEVIPGPPRASDRAWSFLAVAPDFVDEPEVGVSVAAIRRRALDRWATVRRVLVAIDEAGEALDRGELPTELLRRIEKNLLWRAATAGVDSGTIASLWSVQHSVAARAFSLALSLSAQEQVAGKLNAALEHTEAAQRLAPPDLEETVAARHRLLAHARAAQLAVEAADWLANDPLRAEARIERALELEATPERERFANRVATVAGRWTPTHVKTLAATVESGSLAVSFQLGADEGGMVSAPGVARLAAGRFTSEVHVTPDDYRLSEVVVGGRSYGWERTYSFERIPVAAIGACDKVELVFQQPGARTLRATRSVSLGP